MTITNDQIKKAFAPIANITKAEPVKLDLEGVATSLITKTADFANADNPLAELDGLEDVVNKVDHMLGHAVESEDGVSFLVSGDSLACATAKSLSPKASETQTASSAAAIDKGSEEEPAETSQAEKDKATEVDKLNHTDDEGKTKGKKKKKKKTEKNDDEMDLRDDISWEKDLAPSHPPTLKSERQTKDERVVPARKGGRDSTQKAKTAREKAMARRDERVSGAGRNLS